MVATWMQWFSIVLQIGIFLAVLGIAVGEGAHWSTIAGVGIAAALLSAAIIGFTIAQMRTGVYEDREGLTVKWAFSSSRIPFSDLAGFEWRRQGLAKVVYARLTSGRLEMLPVVQGQVVVWDSGRTRDIIGVLTARAETATLGASSARSQTRTPASPPAM